MHGGPDEPELLPQPPLEEPQVARLHRPGGEEHERRRPDLRLGAEQDPRLLSAADRVRVGRHHPAEEGVQPAATEQGRYTAHIKRNRFHVKFRCLGAYEAEPQEGDAGRPVLFNVEPRPFWVQKGRPYALFERGDLGGDQQYFDLVDRVELEFAIETVAQR